MITEKSGSGNATQNFPSRAKKVHRPLLFFFTGIVESDCGVGPDTGFVLRNVGSFRDILEESTSFCVSFDKLVHK